MVFTAFPSERLFDELKNPREALSVTTKERLEIFPQALPSKMDQALH
jgi:hypothetical protein